MSRSVHIAEVICPSCRSKNGLASTLSGGAPRDGDAAMCFTCGEVLIFDRRAKGRARQPTAGEQAELDQDVRIFKIRQAWKQVAFE